MAGTAPYVFPTNALTTQFAQASVAEKNIEYPDYPFEAEPARLQEAHASSADRDADGKYFGSRHQPEDEEPVPQEFDGVFALGRSSCQHCSGHLLERLAGLGSVVDSEY